MSSENELLDSLRSWLLGKLHVGTVKPGDSIPSIREVARTHSVDHRAVARAYAALQSEGLVEVRGRSGVFAVSASSDRQALLHGRRAWLADVIYGAWARQITPAELSELILRCTRHSLRCACVEGTEDHAVAMAAEVSYGFGFETVVHRFAARPDGTPEDTAVEELARVIASTDMTITTVFHSHAVGPLAQRLGRSAIPIAINPALREELLRRMTSPLTVVVADPGYAARARVYFREDEIAGRLEFLLADEVDPESLEGRDDVLLTRAARRRLGLAEYHLLSPATPFIAPDSARDIVGAIVRLALHEQ